jgi:colanic acid/amylovoran biosynthesis glycosyltransferase
MRVAYVTMRFPEPSETFAANEVRTLRDRGVDVVVHGLRRRHPEAADMLRLRRLVGLRTTHNGPLATARGFLHALGRPRLLGRMIRWIFQRNRQRLRDLLGSLVLVPRAFDILADVERQGPDVVHMYWGHFPSLVGFLVQERLPSVVTSISIVAYDLRREYGGTVDVARRADVVRTHARVNRAHIQRFTGVPLERIEVIYNGVDLARVDQIATGLSKVSHRIVTVARLIKSKGVDRTLEAFASVRERWPDATLVIVGSGPDLTRLEALRDALELGTSVQFKGFLAHDQVVEEVAKSEVLMLLSRSVDERLPNVVKEGMACACVCVTTPTAGIDELVVDGVTGFVVPMDASEPAAQAVHRVFAREFDVDGMIVASLSHVRDYFDVTRTAPRFAQLWGEAIARRGDSSADSRT